ncbi:MAG: hypothetical protein M1825_000600 [Sarcosagium campestre]|nr:MAG: hypothetical protein M1825_000600 [Sarcosagium campestre]
MVNPNKRKRESFTPGDKSIAQIEENPKKRSRKRGKNGREEVRHNPAHAPSNSEKVFGIESQVSLSTSKSRPKNSKPHTDTSHEQATATNLPQRVGESGGRGNKSRHVLITNTQGQNLKETRKDLHGNGYPQPSAANWKLSSAKGGRYINAPPVFTRTERYLLLSFKTALQVYSTEGSSLKRSLPVISESDWGDSITSYSLSSVNDDQVFITTSSGSLHLWNWVEGSPLGRWKIGQHAFAVQPESQLVSETPKDLIFTCSRVQSKLYHIQVSRFRENDPLLSLESRSIYNTRSPITAFRTLLHGRCVVIASGKRLILGEMNVEESNSFDDITFTWREFSTPNRIKAVDVRIATAVPSAKKGRDSKHQKKNEERLDVVIGDVEGEIYVYRDLLSYLIQVEQKTHGANTGTQYSPLRLHWHRTAVQSVRWSLDGNYLISGGQETVLVLWQLDTNRQQYLPHLSAPIEDIVVSPRGSSYAIRLSGNTAMILSTSELKATASFQGIQVERALDRVAPAPHRSIPQSSVCHGIISPIKSSHFLLVVPSFQSKPQGPSSSVYLQTFDIVAGHHVARQALARSNVTIRNVGPDGQKLTEPDVKFMQISHDGHWLATVDSWQPPEKILEQFALDDDDLYAKKAECNEVFLKFWCYNDASENWELVTRIDSPHSTIDDLINGKVLHLVADTAGTGFASIGEDGKIRIWRPRTRLRNNMVMRGTDDEDLVTWGCQETVPLKKPLSPWSVGETTSDHQRPSLRARLAFSGDGSVLAATFQNDRVSGSSIVHFIDPSSGRLHRTQSGLFVGELKALDFVDRYLIAVSDHLLLWDTINNQVVYGYSIIHSRPSSDADLVSTHLAVNRVDGTFAVALSFIEKSSKKHSKGHHRHGGQVTTEVSVLDPTTATPLSIISLASTVTALSPPGGQSKGYVILDDEAEVRTLAPAGVLALPFPTTEPSEAEVEDREPDTMEIDLPTQDIDEEVDASHSHDDLYRMESGAEDVPVVRAEQLTDIFDTGPAAYNTPVGELFDRVVGLFTSKQEGVSA